MANREPSHDIKICLDTFHISFSQFYNNVVSLTPFPDKVFNNIMNYHVCKENTNVSIKVFNKRSGEFVAAVSKCSVFFLISFIHDSFH